MSRRGSGAQCRAVAADHVAIEAGALLGRAFLGFVVHVYDPEPLGIAEAPLVVVEQAPGEIATQIDSLPNRVARGFQVLAIVPDAKGIVDLPVDRVRRIVE